VRQALPGTPPAVTWACLLLAALVQQAVE